MQKYQDVVLTPDGSVVSGASVLVQSYPGAVDAVIYSDNAGATKANPLTTDALGRFWFYAADGQYQLVVSGTGIATQIITDVSLGDVEFSVKQFGVVGDGVADDTVALEATRVAMAALTQRAKLVFPPGTYKYSVSPNWALQNLWIEAEGEVRLLYTGVDNCLIFDAGASDSVNNVHFTGNFIIEGGVGSKNGVYVRAVHHSEIKARVFGCGATYAALRTEFTVLNEYDVVSTVNEEGWYSRPAYGYWLGRRSAGENTSACVFTKPIVEALATAGMVLEYAINCQFHGGTSEGNLGYGLDIRSTSEYNKFYGIDLEVNTLEDIKDAGLYNEFHGAISIGNVTVTNAAVGTKFIGGTFNAIADSGNGTAFLNISYSNAGGAITGTENKRIKLGVYNQTGAAFDEDQMASGLVSPANKTMVASTSGTTIDFTSIPSRAKKITVQFSGVSLSGTDNILVQIGDSGGIETSGYLGASGSIQNAGASATANFTTGFGIIDGAAANVIHGSMTLTLMDAATNLWQATSAFGLSNAAVTLHGGGAKALSAALDRVRIATTGANTFDAGNVNVLYE